MKTGRKKSGGKYHKARKKKLYESEGSERRVRLGKEKRKIKKERGGSRQLILLSSQTANVIGKDKKAKKVKIKSVLETPSNRFLARQNILIKGAIIETEIGKARITNRPSQEGSVQATLLEDQE